MKKFFWVAILVVMAACVYGISSEIKFAGSSTQPVIAEVIDSVAGKLIPARLAKSSNNTVQSKESTAVSNAPLTDPTEALKSKNTVEVVPAEFIPTYKLQSGSPSYLANFHYPDAGCAWQGVAGQVFGADGKPVKGLVIKVTGTWNGYEISKIAVTGTVLNKPYGQGGYEIVLGDVAFKSETPLYIQVFDDTNNPLSKPKEFYTKEKCNRNLVLINFVKK